MMEVQNEHGFIHSRTPTELLVLKHFGDIAQLETYGLLHFYEQMNADSEVAERRQLLVAGAALSNEDDVFLGYYRTASGGTVPLTVKSVCENYILKYNN
jgi:hypothetical protein